VPFRWSRKHKPATAGTPADAALAQLLAGFADEILQLTPTTASSLGLDKGERAALKGKLEDASPAGDAAWAAQVHSMLQRLNAIDRNALGADAQVRYDTVRYAASEGEAGIRFSFGGAASGFFGGTAPYPVTQQDGAIVRIPEFLDSQHQIASAADAEAYLERVAALASVLDQETARIKQQASQGIMPPNYIARTALGQLQDYRKTRAAEQKLVTSLTERTAKLGLAGNWQQRAQKLVESAVYPALDRQIAAFRKATAHAPATAGVHRLPDGAAYYEWALKLGTSTKQSAREIHAIGLQQNPRNSGPHRCHPEIARHDARQVGARLQALAKDPARFYADDDAGRAQLIAYCNERVEAFRALMPQISKLGLKVPLQIKRVPADIEAGAALGYMNFGLARWFVRPSTTST
jgi:uncharacterized protein (DUF885 family)